MKQHIKILLADDDDDDRYFFSTALKSINANIDLTTVINGEEFINYFKMENPVMDFIFLDINMPKADGIECLKFIKNFDPYKDIPVIMLSTASSHKLVELTRKYGATAYIEKPSQIKELGRFLNYCLHTLKCASLDPDFLLNTRLKESL